MAGVFGSGFELADPWLLLLAPLPLLALRLRPRGGAGAALAAPESVTRAFAGGGAGGAAASTIRWAPVAIWLLLVAALSGPRWLTPSAALPVSGRELILALDLSGSMILEDFELDGRPARRLDAVKRVGAEFVRGRGGDRIALVIFASRAFFATPQTYDVEAVAAELEASTIGVAGRATGISDGLGLALRRLEDVPASSRVIVLLSDGSNNTGPVRPRDAARLAGEMGVRVHTIALGPHALGEVGAGRDSVDAATLEAIAELSGGETFRVRTMEDLEAVADAIDTLETLETDGPAALLRRELWPWPAALALLLTIGVAVREART